tara:strand:+ start:72148 stop:72480 length:333 start_codon:yes stop_codon:yes gene_type:complete
MITKKILLLIFTLTFSTFIGCTYSVHQVPISDFKPYTNAASGKPVEARGSQFVVMGFTQETNYVDRAYTQLQGQCVGGTVTGIATKSYSEHGFFSWTNHVHMQGLCVRGN